MKEVLRSLLEDFYYTVRRNMQNQKIPITVIITLLIQTVALIWWLSKLDSRVQFHDKLIEYGLMEKVLVLEERVKNLSEELDEFKLQVLSGKIKS